MDTRHAALLIVLAGSLLMVSNASASATVYPDGLTVNEAGVAEGYVIYPSQDQNVHMIDVEGNVVHSWNPPCGWAGTIEELPNGHILLNSCGSLVELDWDSTVVWQVDPPPGVSFHHDWERLPNGNTLTLCFEQIIDPSISDTSIRADFIQEITPSGEVVWEWHETDHFAEFGFSQARQELIHARGGDWSHANTIATIPDNTSHTDPRFTPGNIVISLRHQNTIAIIDRVTNEIVWVLSDRTIGQHATHMLPDDLPGGGNILVFDNGWVPSWSALNWVDPDESVGRVNRYYSRVAEIDPLTGNFTYTYTAAVSGFRNGTFFSFARSGAQRLSNGNTLITESGSGRLFEITAGGQIVWEYIIPFLGANNSRETHRAIKVPLDWAGPQFAPDLVVSGDESSNPAQAGDDLDYTIQLDNVGSDPAVHVELTGETPIGTTFGSIVAPAGWNCSTPAVGGTGSITCSKSSLSAGATAVFTVTVGVDFCAGDGTTLNNMATVSSEGSDVTPGDNSTTIHTTVSGTDCSDTDLCSVDSCDVILQQCDHTSVACTPSDSCHDAGLCDPGTGLCSDPAKEDGTPCDDGDPATCDDLCDGGSCAGTLVGEPAEINDSVVVSHSGGTTTIDWNDPPGDYNAYSGTILAGSQFAYDHACQTPAGPLSGMSTTDSVIPAAKTATYFLVTRVDRCRESISGRDSAGAQRTDPFPCP